MTVQIFDPSEPVGPRLQPGLSLPVEFPEYQICRVPVGGEYSWMARAWSVATRPWCVIAHDPDELREELRAPLRPRS